MTRLYEWLDFMFKSPVDWVQVNDVPKIFRSVCIDDHEAPIIEKTVSKFDEAFGKGVIEVTLSCLYQPDWIIKLIWVDTWSYGDMEFHRSLL